MTGQGRNYIGMKDRPAPDYESGEESPGYDEWPKTVGYKPDWRRSGFVGSHLLALLLGICFGMLMLTASICLYLWMARA